MGVPQQKVIHTTTWDTKKAPMVNRNIMVQEISHNVMRALALIMFGAIIGGSTLFAGWTLCLCLNTEITTGRHRQLLSEASGVEMWQPEVKMCWPGTPWLIPTQVELAIL